MITDEMREAVLRHVNEVRNRLGWGDYKGYFKETWNRPMCPIERMITDDKIDTYFSSGITVTRQHTVFPGHRLIHESLIRGFVTIVDNSATGE